MKIDQVAIVGRGVIGSLLAARCLRKDINYVSLTRHAEVSKQRIKFLNGKNYQLAPPVMMETCQALPKLLIVPVKSYQVEEAVADCAHLLSPKHIIVLLHNGMGPQQRICQLYPNNTVLAATTSMAGYADGQAIVHVNKGQTDIGFMQNHLSQKDTDKVVKLLTGLLPNPQWHDDIRLPLMTKLAINAVINPLTALHQVKNGELINPQYLKLANDVLKEVKLVAKKMDIPLKRSQLYDRLIEVIKDTRDNYSSMYQDIKFNRPTEINEINGFLVTQAEDLHLSVPRNKALLQAVLNKLSEQ